MSSLNTIEFGHLIQYLLYILQYILQKYPKTCGHFCCGKSSDNIFWTPHNLKYMAHMQNPDCKTFYVSRNSSSCELYIWSHSENHQDIDGEHWDRSSKNVSITILKYCDRDNFYKYFLGIFNSTLFWNSRPCFEFS